MPTDASPAADTQANPRRAFIRHTAGVPIEVRAVPGSAGVKLESTNVSEGGISFISDRDFAAEELSSISAELGSLNNLSLEAR